MTDYIKREDVMELLDMLLEHYHDTGVEVIKHTAAIAPKEFHISEADDIADFNFELDGWRNDFMKIESADVVPVELVAEMFDNVEPCNFGLFGVSVDDFMFKECGYWCESNCDKVPAVECWKKFIETWEKRRNEWQ